MLKLAKLLHHKGFHIAFVNTEYNHKRFLKFLGPSSLDGLPDFRYETIPDGLSDTNPRQEFPLLQESIRKNFLAPLRNLLKKLNDSNPPVTCMVSDGFVTSTITAAKELGIPIVVLLPFAAAGFMGSKQYPILVEKGLAPLKDESCLTKGFLEMILAAERLYRRGFLVNLSIDIMTTPHDTTQQFGDDVPDEGTSTSGQEASHDYDGPDGAFRAIEDLTQLMQAHVQAASSKEKPLYGEFCTHKLSSFDGSVDPWAAES
ncbi:7-deoxyloganetin glucosyltransferase-like [Malus sylvestris]|uniref:7-deoxyloganetin glucosyltransferase-like n=1 Tax=Malus sylvestris TaxID=3752 RepID=UPI0021AC9AC6|nr:7-deoxyloganetin glucosyltransferase-like [Malus sylvestris]